MNNFINYVCNILFEFVVFVFLYKTNFYMLTTQ